MPNHSMSLEHVVLKGSRRNHRPGAQVLGRSNRHEWCEITVKLRRKQALPEPVPGKAVISREAAATYGAPALPVARGFDGSAVAPSLPGSDATALRADPGPERHEPGRPSFSPAFSTIWGERTRRGSREH